MLNFLATVLLICCTSVLVSAQTKPNARTWLNGTWEGTGYQIDTAETWTMRLTVKGGHYRIEYPSLNCSGRWQPVRVTAWRARFRERILIAPDQCTNNGRVVVERLSRRQIAFRYTNQGETDVSASAILSKKK
jgi:hypothetical protein